MSIDITYSASLGVAETEEKMERTPALNGRRWLAGATCWTAQFYIWHPRAPERARVPCGWGTTRFSGHFSRRTAAVVADRRQTWRALTAGGLTRIEVFYTSLRPSCPVLSPFPCRDTASRWSSESVYQPHRAAYLTKTDRIQVLSTLSQGIFAGIMSS